MNKPSRKIIALAIISLSIILTSGIVKYKEQVTVLKEKVFGPSEKKITSITPEITDIEVDTSSSVDTDNDGLRDWEETLWGTNNANKDSDGDGTLDGEEVVKNRNPLVAGPNDILSEKEIQTKQGVLEIQNNLSPSDTFARNVFTEVVSLKESDSFTPENKTKVVEELTKSARQNFSYNSYTRVGLTVFSGEEKEKIKKYASEFATIQIDMFLEMYKNKDIFQNNVSKMSEIYSKTASKLYTIAIPQSISDAHLTVVNNYELSAAAFSYIHNYKKDPVTAGIALQHYQNINEAQNEALKTIAGYLRKNDIIFSEENTKNFWNRF